MLSWGWSWPNSLSCVSGHTLFPLHYNEFIGSLKSKNATNICKRGWTWWILTLKNSWRMRSIAPMDEMRWRKQLFVNEPEEMTDRVSPKASWTMCQWWSAEQCLGWDWCLLCKQLIHHWRGGGWNAPSQQRFVQQTKTWIKNRIKGLSGNQNQTLSLNRSTAIILFKLEILIFKYI